MARLIGWWPLHKDTRDWSGNENHMTEVNTTLQTQGIIGSCREFKDNELSYLIQRNIDWLDIAGPFTYCAWLYNTRSSSIQFLLQLEAASGRGNFFNLELHALDRLKLYACGGAVTPEINFPDNMTVNTWVHLAYRFTGEKLQVFINGKFNGEVPVVFPYTDYPHDNNGIVIGSEQDGVNGGHNTSQDFAGRMNDVRWYSGALSDAEIREISQAKLLHWSFDDPYAFLCENLYKSETMTGWSCTKTPEGEWRYKVTGTGSWRGIQQASTSDRVVMEPDGVYCLSFEMLSEDRDISIMVDVNSAALTTSTGTNDNTQWRDFNSKGESAYKMAVKRGQWNTYWVAWKVDTGQQFREESVLGAVDSVDLGDVGAWFRVRNIQLTRSRYPIPYRPFGQPRTSGKIRDLSGLGNEPVVDEHSPSPTPSINSALGQGSAYFDGTNYLKLVNPLAGYGVGSRQQWTASVWFKLDTDHVGHNLVDFNQGCSIWRDSRKTALLYLNGGANDYYMYSKVIDFEANWQHMAFVFDNTGDRDIRDIYVNGILHSDGTGPNRTNTVSGMKVDLIVGKDTHGDLDDVRIYGRALTAQEVSDLYHVRATMSDTGRMRCSHVVESKSNVQEKRWTFHYNRTSHFIAPKWLPLGSFEIMADLRLNLMEVEGGSPHWIKIGSMSTSHQVMHSRALSDGAMQFGFHGNDLQTASGAFRPNMVNKFYFKFEATSATHGTMTLRCNDISISATNRLKYAGDGTFFLGSQYSIGWDGQITNVQLIDLEVPHNSRFYGGINHQQEAPSSTNIRLIDESGWQQLQQMTTCTLATDSGGDVKYSATVVTGGHLIVGEKYKCTVNVESIGGSNRQSGWSSRNGISSEYRWTTTGVKQFEFTCTATNQDLLLFTYGTVTFKNIKVERNTDGSAVTPDSRPWVRQLRSGEHYLSDSPLVLGRGISYDHNNNVVFTSKIESGGTIAGSWDKARNKGYPAVNSIWVAPNGAMVTNSGTVDLNGYVGGVRSAKGSSISYIIEGFQYPNVFKIIEPTDPEYNTVADRKPYDVSSRGVVKTNRLSEIGLTDGLVGYWNFRQDLRGLCPGNGEMEFYVADHAETTLTSEGVKCTRSAVDKISGGLYGNSRDLCLIKGQELTECFTLMVWCCPSNATQDKEAMLLAKSGNHTGLVIEGNRFSFRFPMSDGGSITNCTSTNTVEADRWYRVVGVKNKATIRLYVDGTLNNSKTISGSYLCTTGENFRLGTTSRSNTGTSEAPVWRSNYQFQGTLAEAKIFNRPLTHEEALWESSRHLKSGSVIGGRLMVNKLSENII